MAKFGDDIRRIARYQELLDLIRKNDSAVNQTAKSALDGARGIAFGSNAANTSKGSTGTAPPSGTGNANSDGKATKAGTQAGEAAATDGAADALSAATLNGTTADLDSADNTARDGWYDTTSLVDAAVDALGKSPAGDSKVNSLTGLTTDDGLRKLVVHLQDAALAFIGPSDWEGSLTPIQDSTWNANYYYTATNFAGSATESTFNRAGKAVADLTRGFYITGLASTITNVEYVSTTIGGGGSGDYTINYYYTNSSGVVTGPVANNIGVTRNSCTAPGNPSAFCLTSAPTTTTWGVDLGVTQLAFATAITPLLSVIPYSSVGRFIPSPYDINIPTEYGDGASILDVKNLAGDPLRIGALKDGGFYIYYRDVSAGNAPLGAGTANTVYTVGSNKIPTGFITPNELGKLLPY